MRAVFITLALVVAAAAGYFIYRSSAPKADDPGLFAPEQQTAALPTAEDCVAENAVYEFNDDRRLQLRFRRLSSGSASIEMSEVEGQRLGNVAFVVHVTSLGTDYVYTPVNALRGSGPAHTNTLTRVQAEGGGAPFAVYLFDSEMHYLDQLPRNDTPAPGYIFMPDILPRLYRDRVDQAPGVFRFQSCATPAAPAPAP
jgi:hypothetical protein